MIDEHEIQVKLYEAVVCDDVAAVEAIFQNHNVLKYVRATETTVAQLVAQGRDPFVEHFFRPFHLSCPGYFGFPGEFVLSEAAQREKLDVLAWFFAPERLQIMGTTLRCLVPHITKSVTSESVLEMLLNSSMVHEFGSSLLQKMLKSTINSRVVDLLVAHGAVVDSTIVHEWIEYGDANTELLDTTVHHGMSLVGSEILDKTTIGPEGIPLARRLLQLGSTRQRLGRKAFRSHDDFSNGISPHQGNGIRQRRHGTLASTGRVRGRRCS